MDIPFVDIDAFKEELSDFKAQICVHHKTTPSVFWHEPIFEAIQ